MHAFYILPSAYSYHLQYLLLLLAMDAKSFQCFILLFSHLSSTMQASFFYCYFMNSDGLQKLEE